MESIINFIVFLLQLAVIVAVIAGFWQVFVKAGKPGWACLIPIYNIIVLLEIAGKPLWWLILLLIPLVGLVMSFIINIALAEKFGKGAGFGVGLTLLPFIFFPILGFGNAGYRG